MKKRYHLLIFILIGLLSIKCQNELEEFPILDLSLKLPENYQPMNVEQFKDFFTKKEYNDSIINERIDKMLRLNKIPKYVYLQDTTNIFSNIVLFEIPLYT